MRWVDFESLASTVKKTPVVVTEEAPVAALFASKQACLAASDATDLAKGFRVEEPVIPPPWRLQSRKNERAPRNGAGVGWYAPRFAWSAGAMLPRTKTGDSQPIAIVCICGDGTIRVRVENEQEIVMPCTSCGSVDVNAARGKKW